MFNDMKNVLIFTFCIIVPLNVGSQKSQAEKILVSRLHDQNNFIKIVIRQHKIIKAKNNSHQLFKGELLKSSVDVELFIRIVF